MRGDREELLALANGGLGLAVEARVVDREGGAPGQLIGHAQIGGIVAPRPGQPEYDRAERPLAHP